MSFIAREKAQDGTRTHVATLRVLSLNDQTTEDAGARIRTQPGRFEGPATSPEATVRGTPLFRCDGTLLACDLCREVLQFDRPIASADCGVSSSTYFSWRF